MLITDQNVADEFYQALLRRDESYVGTFIVGVITTSVFCIPTCRARKPKRENVLFFAHTSDAEAAGFRPCKVCRPLADHGIPPEQVLRVITLLEADQSTKLTDAMLKELGLSPSFLRRWFQQHLGRSFHEFRREITLRRAREKLEMGERVTEAAFNSGYESLSGFVSAYKKVLGNTPRTHKKKT